MAIQQTFAPAYGQGQTITTGASAVATIGAGCKVICLTNLHATETAYVRTGPTSTLTATAADYPVLAGNQVTISKPMDDGYLATYSSGAGSLHIMPGEGY